MRRGWESLRSILLVVLFAAAAEGLIWLALQYTSGEMIVPQPGTVAEEFSAALAAHRWNGAVELLDEGLHQQVTVEELRSLMERIEQNHPAIDHVTTLSEEKQGEQAAAAIGFVFTGQRQAEVPYTLIRENHLWRIASLEGLSSLAGSP